METDSAKAQLMEACIMDEEAEFCQRCKVAVPLEHAVVWRNGKKFCCTVCSIEQFTRRAGIAALRDGCDDNAARWRVLEMGCPTCGFDWKHPAMLRHNDWICCQNCMGLFMGWKRAANLAHRHMAGMGAERRLALLGVEQGGMKQ